MSCRENSVIRTYLKRSLVFSILLATVTISLAIPAPCQPVPAHAASSPSTPPAYMQGPPSIPAQFSGDWYQVSGGPDLQIALTRSSVDQNEDTSLFLTATNIGGVTSFRALSQPNPSQPEEVFAAQKELQLEAQRSTAQDVSVRLVPENSSSMNLKREIAYAGSLREGQVSMPLEYPVEVYENTAPGNYTLYAIANYTYQQDVAVKPHSDSPENPDVFYWYNTASQVVPLTLRVERNSLVDIKAVSVSPKSLSIGSKNNIVNIIIQNQGTDTAKDIVARLKPETGVYVDMDESPIPLLLPGEKAELVYKVDVSKDAVADKLYRFTLLFDYSDSYRKNLQDSDNIYISIQTSLTGLILQYWWVAAIIVAVAALAVISVIRRRRGAAGQ